MWVDALLDCNIIITIKLICRIWNRQIYGWGERGLDCRKRRVVSIHWEKIREIPTENRFRRGQIYKPQQTQILCVISPRGKAISGDKLYSGNNFRRPYNHRWRIYLEFSVRVSALVPNVRHQPTEHGQFFLCLFTDEDLQYSGESLRRRRRTSWVSSQFVPQNKKD